MVHKLLLLTCFMAASFAAAGTEINQADVAALDSIRGIGPSLSRKILAEREHGAFKSWADLQNRVPGIQGKTAAKFSAQGLTVDGASFTGPVKP